MYTPDITVMDRAFQFGIVDLLTNLLNTNNASTISEVCWILSNMVVSSSAFVSNFVEHPVLSKIMTLCQSKSITIKKESLYVLANCVSSADVITLERILQKDDHIVLDLLKAGLHLNDHKLILNFLDCLNKLLKLDETLGWAFSERSVAFFMSEMGYQEALSELMTHSNPAIAETAGEICDKYLAETIEQEICAEWREQNQYL